MATVDATGIALDRKLGTRSVPIVNTAMAGAVARLMALDPETLRRALDEMGFGRANFEAAQRAFNEVRSAPASAAPPRQPRA